MGLVQFVMEVTNECQNDIVLSFLCTMKLAMIGSEREKLGKWVLRTVFCLARELSDGDCLSLDLEVQTFYVCGKAFEARLAGPN